MAAEFSRRAGGGLRSRLALLVLVLALLATFVIGWRLFLEHPYFGTIPSLPFLPVIRAPYERAWLGLSIALLIPLPLVRRPAPWITTWLFVFGLRCAWDRMTWQPYLLHYGVLLLGLASTFRRPDARELGGSFRFALASVYLWAGLSKVNSAFLRPEAHGMRPPFVTAWEIDGHYPLFLLIPVVEILLFVGLLIRPARRIAVVAALLFHLVVLGYIGPFGLDYNHVVWPWNVSLMLLIPLAFWPVKEVRVEGAREALGSRCLVAILCALGPLLSYFGWTDRYLFFHLYTPRVPTAILHHASDELDTQSAAVPEGPIHIPWWSEEELGAFAPPNEIVYRHVARRFCERGQVALEVNRPSGWWPTVFERESLDCADLSSEGPSSE